MSCNTGNVCKDEFGCSGSICPEFVIKRHSTRPAFEVTVKDCGDPIDLTDAVLEVSMWASVKLKSAITADDEYFDLADNIGFQQINVGDIIVVEQVRFPEQMLVIAFDESNKLIKVERAYNGTEAVSHKKGTKLKSFRFLNSVGETQMILRDIPQEDGTVQTDVLVESKLIYEWDAADTCLPGCYFLEMKLLKMTGSSMMFTSMNLVPSFISYTTSQVSCGLGDGVEWVRRFPEDREGFLIQIVGSPVENG